MNGNQYFLLNGQQDFMWQGSWFCSGLLDSGEKQTEWNRLKIMSEKSNGCRLWIFISEQKNYMEAGQKKELEQLLKAPNIEMPEKMKRFSSFQGCFVENKEDVLLSDIRGRYLWLVGNAEPELFGKITGIQLFFQADTWLSLLPEVYQEKGRPFLEKYLGIFQWLYYDMTQIISAVPHRLYPAHADRELLEQLAKWFDVENITIWNQRQLIYLIENAGRLSGIRGTKAYMQEMVFLYTGQKPYIIEYYQIDPYKTDLKKRKTLERLYGEDVYMVTVILPPGSITDRQRIAVLQRIIRFAAPAYIECRLVVLESCIYLDGYSYIGLNSYLSGYQNVWLHNSRLAPYRSIIGKER